MPTVKLTRRALAAIKPTGKRAFYFDTDLSGFGLKLEPSGAASWFLEYRAGAGGRGAAKRRMKIGDATDMTPEAARERAKDLLAEIRLGGDPAATKAKAKTVPTFRAFAAEHLDAMAAMAEKHPEQATLRPGSIRNYRSLLKKHVGPAIGSRQLDAITREEAKRLHTKVGKEAPATANRCLEFIGSIFKAAADAGHVEEGTNPARGIRAFKERSRERFLSAEELARLGEAIAAAETTGVPYEPPAREGKKAKHVPKEMPPYVIGADSAAALRLLILTGARLREILHARWDQIDLERGLLSVFGKTGRRYVFLPAPALEILAGLPRGLGPFVFPSSLDCNKPKADLNKPWRAVRKLAGLDDVRIHDLRHSFASVAVSGGAPLAVIGKILGHASPVMTGRYAHLSADPVRAAAEAAAGTIAAAMARTTGEVIPMPERGKANG